MKLAANRMEFLSTTFFAALGPRLEAMRKAGLDVICLDEGSPDLPPSPPIIAALARAASSTDELSRKSHSYQPHRGISPLRQAWAEMYRRVYNGVNLNPETEIIPLLGSKEGIFHLPGAILNPGEAALIPDPGYMTYVRGTLFAGAYPFPIPLLPENDYLPDLEAIPSELLRKAKILWLNYPNNPTGAVASLDFFKQAVDFARQHQLLLCHDAPYTQVTFDGYHAPSILEVEGAKEVAVEFNSLSKSHNMAGWRAGVLVGNALALKEAYTLKTNIDSGQFYPVQVASVEAMTGDQSWLKGRNLVYQARRDVVINQLLAIGLTAAVPRAGLYIWCPIPKRYSSCEDFVSAVLEKAYVSLTPGTIFGKFGEGYVRISLTAPVERLAEAMQRIQKAGLVQ
jgi:LL-diaminopimelate aminotransferase